MLNGIDISSYIISAEGEKDYTETVGTANFQISLAIENVMSIDGTLNGKSITWQRGVLSATEFYKFRGLVVNVKRGPSYFTLVCKNKYYIAQRREVTTSYDKNIDPEAGVLSAIFTDLMSSYAGLNVDSSTVQNSGTLYTVNKFVCRRSQVYERGDDIAEALNWQHYYNDYDDYVYLEPRGFVDSGVTLQVGVNVTESPTFNFDASKLTNKLTVEGAVQAVQSTIFSNGTNVAGQTVTLTYAPTSVKVYVGTGTYTPGSGTKPSLTETNLKVGGKINATTGTYDYVYDDEPNIKKVYFYDTTLGSQPSFTPGTGTNNIEIQYTYDVPTPITIKNQSSIDTYGLYEKTITKDDIKTVSDAEIYAQNYLARFSQPFTVSTLKVSGLDDIRAGRMYTVIDTEKGINMQLVVSKVKYFYPFKPDEITVGDAVAMEQDIQTDLLDRVKRLEEKDQNNDGILRQLITFETETTIGNRYFSLSHRDTSPDGIWGVGVWGVVYWSGSYTNPLVEVFHQPGNNIFEEYVYDDLYYEDDSSLSLYLNLNKNPVSSVVDDFSDYGNNGTYNINATAYYPFNGNANDASVNGNNGTLVNSPTLTTDHLGSANNAYSFPGTTTNVRIDAPTAVMGTSGTISMWIKKNGNGTPDAGGTISFFNSNRDTRTRLNCTNAGNVQFIKGSNSAISSAYSITNGTWYHIVGTWSAGVGSFYVNGTQVGSNLAYTDTTTAASFVYIGTSTTGAQPGSFNGDISDVLFLNGVTLTASEVANLYAVTSVHKLDKPLVTKTGSNGVSITGYELSPATTYISLPDVTNVDNGSFSVYQEFMIGVSTGTAFASNLIQSKRLGGNSWQLSVELSPLKPVLTFWDSVDSSTARSITSSVSVAAGEVHKVLWTVTGTTWTMYLNGVQVGTTSAYNGISSRGTAQYLGMNSDWNTGANLNRRFIGVLSRPLIFSRVLSSAERTQIFNGGVPGSFGTSWNTTTKEITISNSGQLQTKYFALGTAYSSILVRCRNYTGTMGTVQISGDGGSSWQNISLNTLTPISSTTTAGVYLKITAPSGGGWPTPWNSWGSGSSIVLKNTYTTAGGYEYPAISVELS